MELFAQIGDAAFAPLYDTAPSLIKSIQQVEITIATSASSNTATITAVNTEKTVILYNGQRSSDTTLNPAEDFVRVTLTNATTVTASTNTANAANTRIVCCTVIEFYEWAVNKVIYGTVTSSAGTQADATIANVDTARAAVFYLGQTTDRTSYNVIRDSVILQLLNSTTVRANRGNFTAGDNITVGFCVVEFATDGIIQSIQTAEVQVAASATSGTATISSVTTGNCLTVYGGWWQTVLGTNDTRCFPRGELTNSTTLTCYINTAYSGQTNIRLTVIEFKSKWINSRQAGTITIGSGSGNNTATISSVNTAKTVTSFFYNTTSVNTTDDRAWLTDKLSSSTQVRADRGGTPAISATIGYEAVEFK